ncbi:unnamed protein product [Amoebophrya sp. A120]|nr:unnamed protein product [Amoebophrya sp. A120]|eukprot:GSA120T00004309001.1
MTMMARFLDGQHMTWMELQLEFHLLQFSILYNSFTFCLAFAQMISYPNERLRHFAVLKNEHHEETTFFVEEGISFRHSAAARSWSSSLRPTSALTLPCRRVGGCLQFQKEVSAAHVTIVSVKKSVQLQELILDRYLPLDTSSLSSSITWKDEITHALLLGRMDCFVVFGFG